MPKKPIKIKVEDFKDELFEKEKPEPESEKLKSSCSLVGILTILVLILILVVGGLFFIKNAGWSLTLKQFSFKKPGKAITSEISESEGLTRFRFTEGDLNKAIEKSGDSFPLKKTSAKIKPDGIEIIGKTSDSILGLKVNVTTLPKVESGELKYDIVSIKSSGLEAPKTVKDLINNQLSSFLSGYIPDANTVSVQKVDLYDGFLEITGDKK